MLKTIDTKWSGLGCATILLSLNPMGVPKKGLKIYLFIKWNVIWWTPCKLEVETKLEDGIKLEVGTNLEDGIRLEPSWKLELS